MKKQFSALSAVLAFLLAGCGSSGVVAPAVPAPVNPAPVKTAKNPIIFADVPDMSMIRVGENYYMASTTMHMNPGVPVMKSTDLVNWKTINYAHDSLADMPDLNLTEGKNAYSKGTWASSLRYHKGTYYLATFAQTTGETYIFTTKDIEKGNWKRTSFKPMFHDLSLFFDDDGKIYMVHGGDRLEIVELNADLTLNKNVPARVLIEKASLPAGPKMGLYAEGSQLFKVNGKYYLFNICAPADGGMRTVVIHRADNIKGPWVGKVGLQDRGIAQGGLIDTPDGRWFSYQFRDLAAVGRVPYLVPVKWVDGWPVLGENGKVPEQLDLPASTGLIPNLVDSDEFDRKTGDPALPLVWQWNHNPDNALWSVTERKGFLRLKTGRIDSDFLQARNTLTQRTIGPTSSASIALDVSKMKDGDFAGLSALQREYASVGVKIDAGQKSIVMIATDKDKPVEVQRVPLNQDQIYFRIDCDFTGMNDNANHIYQLNGKDEASFFYSLDGKVWQPIGRPLKMKYTIPHFMGYRFALSNYATKNTGGYVDVDWFRITH